MNPASRKKLFEQLKIDEGVVYKTYEDSLGYLTFGIGHLVLSSDPEYREALGTPIDEERVHEVFEFDLDLHISECSKLYGCYWDEFPDEIQEILVNMCFNMGRTRLGKFKKMTAALQKSDWEEAAKEGRDSRWYAQVGNRAERLMTRMENVSE